MHNNGACVYLHKYYSLNVFCSINAQADVSGFWNWMGKIWLLCHLAWDDMSALRNLHLSSCENIITKTKCHLTIPLF